MRTGCLVTGSIPGVHGEVRAATVALCRFRTPAMVAVPVKVPYAHGLVESSPRVPLK